MVSLKPVRNKKNNNDKKTQKTRQTNKKTKTKNYCGHKFDNLKMTDFT